jgi:hypothetical protein
MCNNNNNNKCNGDCNCENSCNPVDCGCKIELDTICVSYTGEGISPLGVSSGQNLTEILNLISNYLEFILNEVESKESCCSEEAPLCEDIIRNVELNSLKIFSPDFFTTDPLVNRVKITYVDVQGGLNTSMKYKNYEFNGFTNAEIFFNEFANFNYFLELGNVTTFDENGVETNYSSAAKLEIKYKVARSGSDKWSPECSFNFFTNS